MKDLVVVKDGVALVSSKDVADAFGKVHRNVMRDIKALECSDKFRELNFEQSSYTSLQNKTLPSFDMTRDGFAFLCMGFSGKSAATWKEKYINAFNAMEKALTSAPSTMDKLNTLVASIESNKEKASAHGKALSEYRKVKAKQSKEFEEACFEAQIVLNLK